MLFILVQEAYLLEDNQVSDRFSTCLERPEGGARCHLILQLLVGMTHKKIVDSVNIGFIHIFIPHFLTDGLVNVLLFEVGYLCVSLGMIYARVWYDFWYIRFGEGIWCLDHDGCLAAIAVDHTKVPLQLLHCPVKLV